MRSVKLSGSIALMCTAILPMTAMAVSVDLGVPASQSRSIKQDQEYLHKLQFQGGQDDAALNQLLQLKGGVSSRNLQAWLDERVEVVISESMDLDHSVAVAPGRAQYPEANVFPDNVKPIGKPDLKPTPAKPSLESNSKPVMVMANLGAAVYMMGKKAGLLLALKLTSGSFLPILSPHHGFIQIGEGLFMERFRINPAAQDLPANRVARLAVFFHEARHSDGHGKSLAFGHTICPEGHAYAGYPACDLNLNGPYTVGARTIGSMTAACGECSTKEKTALKVLKADSLSRVLSTYSLVVGFPQKANHWSPKHEEILGFVPEKK